MADNNKSSKIEEEIIQDRNYHITRRMVTIHNQNTTFVNATIHAYYDQATGKTMYKVTGADTCFGAPDGIYEGPINISGGKLIVENGAVATDLIVITSDGQWPTVDIQNGGILQNSNVYNAWLNIEDGGLSQNNTYTSINMADICKGIQGISKNDTFGGYNNGQIYDSHLISANGAYHFTPDNGIVSGFNLLNNAKIINPIIKGEPTVGNFTLNGGTEFGNIDVKNNYINNINQTLVRLNENPVFIGGDWVASLDPDTGRTVYTNNITKIIVEGPINLVDINSLTINKGAIVEHLRVTINTRSADSTINNYGTLKDSILSNSTINNHVGAVTENNTFYSINYNGAKGSVTKHDFFYQSATAPFCASDSNGQNRVVDLTQGGVFDGSYVGVDKGAGTYQVLVNGGIINNQDNSDPCFLEGTMIASPKGLIAVEHIQEGDQIITYLDGKEKPSPVIWVGHRTIKVKTTLNDENAGYPVRIIKNAITDGVPFKDMLITAEHCMFFKNHFIPVRMLINGSTIFYDHSIKEYTYYHIETEEHAIIKADGALTESYLDTGHRSVFNHDQKVISIINRGKSWNIDSAAPLGTTKELVEPIFSQLMNRAKDLGYKIELPEKSITNDSALRLVTNTGTTLTKLYQKEGYVAFKIPPDTVYVRLVSRASCPNRVIGPYIDDRRILGVLIGNVTLLRKNQAFSLTEHLSSHTLDGWHTRENANARWTNGNAVINIDNGKADKPGILIIQVLSHDYYINEKSEYQQQLHIA